MSRLITSVLLTGLLSTFCWAQNDSPAGTRTPGARPTLSTTADKRAWLREQVVKGLSNARQLRSVQAHVDLIKPQQVDKLVGAALAQQGAAADALQAAQLELARAQALRQMLEQEFSIWRNGNVGYAPVVTWLPEGTQLGASAVVSPDRRYVRTSVTPFFSSVGPGYSYNLNTGQTRLLPQSGSGTPNSMYGNPYPWPRLGYGQSNMVPVETQSKQKKWGYDQFWGTR